jgi:RNA polymerase sigma-70 factor (ECF subfamily)
VTTELVRAFASKAQASWRAAFEADPALAQCLSALVTRACEGHVALKIPPAVLAAALGERAGEPASTATLEAAHVDDLLLAVACLSGSARGHEELRARIIAEATAAGRKLAGSGQIDETVQLLSQDLLVGESGSPGIARYGGRGPLDGFLRAAATRILLRLRQRERRDEPLDEADAGLSLGDLRDPEIEILKRRYRDDVNDAFRAALAALSHRERAVLRLHLVSGLNIDRIGVCYRVHRATAARWLVHARERLLSEMQRSLVERLKLAPTEATSLARLLRSQIDVTMSGFFSKSDKLKEKD